MRNPSAFLVTLLLLATRAFAAAPFGAWDSSVTDWSRVVDRSEEQRREAFARGCVRPVDRDATVSQIRAGAASLRALLVATSASDTLLGGSLVPLPPPFRRQGEWAIASSGPRACSRSPAAS
jgi:hypothetical protein